MKAAVLHRLGEPPRFEDAPDPVPAADEALVAVTAAPLAAIDRALAAGTHYGSGRLGLPAVCGTTGAGRLPDGRRVLFGSPAGTMAQYAAPRREWCQPIPDGLDDAVAAAALNPGLSAWGVLAWRAKLEAGQSVLVLGATGVTGKLAVQYARRLGAGRVVAAGRNAGTLAALEALGASATIRLDQPDDALADAFRAAGGDGGFDVVVDYLWGRPTEVFLRAIGHRDLELRSSRTRLVQVGEMAGPRVSLPAAVLRSGGLEIIGMGTGSAPPRETMLEALRAQLDLLAAGELRVDVDLLPLAVVAEVWTRDQGGARTVFVP